MPPGWLLSTIQAIRVVGPQLQTCKGSRMWNIVSIKSWGRPLLQGGGRKPREGTQGGPHGASGGGRKTEPEAPGTSRTAMAHLDPAAHHRAHGYDMPPASPPPLCCVFIRPFSFHPKTNVSIWKCQFHACHRRGRGCSWDRAGWAATRRRRGRVGEAPARHVTAAGPVGRDPGRDNKKRTPPNA